MQLTSSGETLNTKEYVIDTIKTFLEIDRSKIYSYTFENLYIDFTKDESIKIAIQNIIDTFELTAEILNIERLIDRIIVTIKIEKETGEVVINGQG